MLFTGVGPRRAARSLAARLARGVLPDVVISSGFAGAVSPAIELSSWITAARICEWSGDAWIPVEGITLAAGPPGLVGCDVLSSDRLVTARAPLPNADSPHPLVVDMESVSLAREAARRGVAFSVVRLISDTPTNPLPAFLSPFAAAMAATDTTSRIALAGRGLRGAITNPRAVAHLLMEAPAWLRALESGWRQFSRSLSPGA